MDNIQIQKHLIQKLVYIVSNACSKFVPKSRIMKRLYWRMKKKVRNDHPTLHNGKYYISKFGEFDFLAYHSYYYIKLYRKKRLKSLKPNNGHGLFDFNYYTCLGNGLFKIVIS